MPCLLPQSAERGGTEFSFVARLEFGLSDFLFGSRAEGWLVLADLMERLEASVSGSPSVDSAE